MSSALLESSPVESTKLLDISSANPDRPLAMQEGVLTAPNDDDTYWGEIPLEQMNRLLTLAQKTSWQEAVEQIVVPNYPRQVDMITSSSRTDWTKLLPEKKHLTTLDVGSGWGQIGRLLASEPTNTVYSLEKIPSRARFQAIRKSQEATKNLHIINAGISDVQLPENSFDLVSFIGVLEWIGTGDAPADPRDVQLEALKKVHAATRPGGSVVIGIENRIGFNCFLGGKDHSGLRFTSLMPRAMANAWVKLRTPRYRSNRDAASYRTYTYSAGGYRKLLAEAGFSNTTVYVSHPHYGYPQCLIEQQNSELRRFFSKVYQPTSARDALFASIFRGLSLLGVAHHFAPHFILIAQK